MGRTVESRGAAYGIASLIKTRAKGRAFVRVAVSSLRPGWRALGTRAGTVWNGEGFEASRHSPITTVNHAGVKWL